MENTGIQIVALEVLKRLSDSISSISSAIESPDDEKLSTFQEIAYSLQEIAYSLHEIATQMSTLNERLQSIDCEISEKLEALTKQIRLLGIGSRTF